MARLYTAHGNHATSMQLKVYQQQTLDALRDYFLRCNDLGSSPKAAALAFYELTGRPYTDVAALPGLPYVCLRVPTGGGKTVLASYAAGIAARDYLRADHALVLWLVPSDPIRQQTLRALRDRAHPFRRALEGRVGAVTVMDVAEALSIQPAALNTSTVVIVSTIQAVRRDDTTGLKVYDGDNGSLMAHFENLPTEALAQLDKNAAGVVERSLANVLRLRRPVVIVDEAHNARTERSFRTLAHFRPACIIEFTATPDMKEAPSNVLKSVSATELNAESMIKMPILLETHAEWKQLLADAVDMLGKLRESARLEQAGAGERIRPIMLIQAERTYKDRETISVDVVRETLLSDHNVPADHIARATGAVDELPDDITASKIEYVITQQKLREGWDCPWAYVLCSVAEVRSATAVEQTLGRVLRLPQATRKAQAALNNAYAYIASASFATAAKALEDALVESGFEKQEARELIVQRPAEILPLFATPVEGAQPLPISVPVNRAPYFGDLDDSLAQKITYDSHSQRVVIKESLSEAEAETVVLAMQGNDDKQAVLYALKTRRVASTAPMSPAEQGVPFRVPKLAIRQGNLLEEFEETALLEMPFELWKQDARLSEAEYSLDQPIGQRGEINVAGGEVKVSFTEDLHQRVQLLTTDLNWSHAELAAWLDGALFRANEHAGFDKKSAIPFLNEALTHLVEARNLPFDQLVRDKYRLAQAVVKKVRAHRDAARQAGFQSLLMPNLVVEDDFAFSFDADPHAYAYNKRYQGRYAFKKHYYPHVGDLDDTDQEEAACAFFIDSMVEVKTWVRNLVRKPNAFWLQTARDRFYPDFVVLLHDGRVLVVEYKGTHLWEGAKLDRDIGGTWEACSGGRCLFIMARDRQYESIRAKVQQK